MIIIHNLSIYARGQLIFKSVKFLCMLHLAYWLPLLQLMSIVAVSKLHGRLSRLVIVLSKSLILLSCIFDVDAL